MTEFQAVVTAARLVTLIFIVRTHMMAEQPDSNPYAAPMVQDVIAQEQAPSAFFLMPRVVQSAWLLAVLVNLPVPVLFGSSMTPDALWFGMAIGVLAVYAVGAWCCSTQTSIMWRLIVGSVLTALSQFWPVLHMLVGMAAIGISRLIFTGVDPNGDNLTRLSQVITATVLTGVGLILPSLFFGLIGIAVLRIRVFDRPVKR